MDNILDLSFQPKETITILSSELHLLSYFQGWIWAKHIHFTNENPKLSNECRMLSWLYHFGVIIDSNVAQYILLQPNISTDSDVNYLTFEQFMLFGQFQNKPYHFLLIQEIKNINYPYLDVNNLQNIKERLEQLKMRDAGKYNFFEHNSEHLANWIINGKYYSAQVNIISDFILAQPVEKIIKTYKERYYVIELIIK